MQTLDVISINIWQILISLANLLIIFLIFKKFLFAPVKKILSKRQEEVDVIYASARKSEDDALANKEKWEEKIKGANAEADAVIQKAAETADKRGEKLIEEARNKAENIIQQAENEAELRLKKAEEDIKTEIVNVSALLTEKMLQREINADDHRTLIDSVIDDIGSDFN